MTWKFDEGTTLEIVYMGGTKGRVRLIRVLEDCPDRVIAYCYDAEAMRNFLKEKISQATYVSSFHVALERNFDAWWNNLSAAYKGGIYGRTTGNNLTQHPTNPKYFCTNRQTKTLTALKREIGYKPSKYASTKAKADAIKRQLQADIEKITKEAKAQIEALNAS